jgi:hypothetical protein
MLKSSAFFLSILWLLGSASLCLADEKPFLHLPKSGNYSERVFLRLDLVHAIQRVESYAERKNISLKGFGVVSITYDEEFLFLTFLNSGGLDGPSIQAKLKLPNYDIVSLN